MSFLSEIRNYAHKAKNTVCKWVGIDNTENKQKAQVKNTPNAVVKQNNPGKNEDEFVKVHSGKNQKSSKQVIDGQTIGSIELKFKDRCNAYGADFIKIKKMLNGNNREFDKLNDTKKIKKYEAIIAALELANSMKTEGRFHANTDINAWAVASAGLQAEVEHINISEQFVKHLSTATEFDKQLKSAKSNEEILSIAKNKNIEITKAYYKEIEKIKKSDKLTNEEKQKAIHHLNKERRILLKDIILSVTASTGDNDKLYFAVRTVDSKDAGTAIRMMRETRLGKKAKTDFSNNITFNKMRAVTASYGEQKGQEFTEQSIRDFNIEITIGKTPDYLKSYQNDYVKARKDNNDKELEHLYTSIAQGIGVGATLNENFESEEDRLNFLSNWEKDARQFNDYEKVLEGRKEAVKEYIEKYKQNNSELTKKIEQIEQKFEESIAKNKTNYNTETLKPHKISNSESVAKQGEIKIARENSGNTSYSSAPFNNASIGKTTEFVAKNTLKTSNRQHSASTESTSLNITSSTDVINTILKEGYTAAPEEKRLKLTLTNPLLSYIIKSDDAVAQDIRNIGDAEYFRSIIFSCKASTRQFILDKANPKIQPDLFKMIKGKVGFDFDKINEDKYSNDNEKEHELV